MEEKLTTDLENSTTEPIIVDNSEKDVNQNPEANQVQVDGKSIEDPSKELILGKFKSVDELVKAYSELQKFQGESSKELEMIAQCLGAKYFKVTYNERKKYFPGNK